MSRKEYFRQWRKENQLLNDFMNQDESESEIEEGPKEDESNIDNGSEQGFISDEEIRYDSDSEIDDGSSDDDSGNELFNDLKDNGAVAEEHNLIENEEQNFVTKLGVWILKNKITRSASDELLTILRENGHGDLPKCSRTILKTPRCVLVSAKCGGEYTYLGLVKSINRVFNENPSYQMNENDTISLIVNVDGVPLHKSSGSQFWPILCQFGKFPPFIVALYYGKTKPTNLKDFLSDFLIEFSELRENGYEKSGINIAVEILAFVCDAPARQFLKCIKGHTGYFGCERCEVEGIHESSRVTFHDTNGKARDNDSFKMNKYTGTHQLDHTILIDFNINCVDRFPLDYMHLVCLGVVKRFLLFLKKGPRAYKLSTAQISVISEKLLEFSGKLPSEFARQPRGLSEVKRWKATEFRQFLLYTGCLVLKDVLTPERYEHFLSLSLAMRILLDSDDDVRSTNLQYANELLRYFTVKSSQFYGRTFCVYNVHNLIHLCDDSDFFKCSLNDISAFQFEDYLQVLKHFVRKAQNPISQVVKRVSELDNLAMNGRICKSHKVVFSNRKKDSWFLLKTGEFAEIKETLLNGMFRCEILYKNYYQNVFNSPCDSKHFNIVFIRNLSSSRVRQVNVHRCNLLRKAVCLPYKDGIVLSAMLHNI